MGVVAGSHAGDRYALDSIAADEHHALTRSTGGSALMAVDVLRSKGVPEERILFLNLIASPQGAENFAKKFPKLRVVTAFVDEGLDEKK